MTGLLLDPADKVTWILIGNSQSETADLYRRTVAVVVMMNIAMEKSIRDMPSMLICA